MDINWTWALTLVVVYTLLHFLEEHFWTEATLGNKYKRQLRKTFLQLGTFLCITCLWGKQERSITVIIWKQDVGKFRYITKIHIYYLYEVKFRYSMQKHDWRDQSISYFKDITMYCIITEWEKIWISLNSVNT